MKDGRVLVAGEETSYLQLELPTLTEVQGQLLDNGIGVDGADIEIRNPDNGNWHYAMTDENGEFAILLSDGSYAVSEVWYYGWKELNFEFEVKDGLLFVDGAETDFLTLEYPRGNVNGKVLDDGVGIGNVEVEILDITGITEYGDYNDWYYTWTNDNGEFSIQLPDGQYRVAWLYFGETISVNVPFEVINGEVVVNGESQEQLSVELLPVTVQGQVLGQGTAAAHATVSVSDGENWYSIYANQNGEFSFRLPDGSYRVERVNHRGRVEMDVTFEVIGGKLFVDGSEVASLQLELPPRTDVKGQVISENFTLDDVEIELRNIDTDIWYATYTEDSNEFLINLPNGRYQVEYIWYRSWFPMSFEFEVKDGRVFVDGEEIAYLQLELPTQ
ncbi:hypothetical protein BKP37_06475 [Anaerobacillus alkalilacustris]|uniref:Carboxypeptidase regulatory-like domain-containing protein n=1 Tax=Anaerobacillus alkalilacustris TaxID=393763 RepID=A0A1S2LSR9_9BACI|nr:carboxypeptidase-like regulatory domain-containing protein [Anaerobacillus alkalilacustris]OIJ15416.1 hypothetical protein BKP37_06475 [Anaerobacillus alkalilacustris]